MTQHEVVPMRAVSVSLFQLPNQLTLTPNSRKWEKPWISSIYDSSVVPLCSFLTEESFEYYSILCISAEDDICKITYDWDQTDYEIKSNIEHHVRVCSFRKATIDLLACSNDHKCHEGIEDVSYPMTIF